MARRKKTQMIIDTAIAVLTEYHPMTLRQVYYQLVSRQVIENNRNSYQATSDALVDARRDGSIPWVWIEDRLRRPREVYMSTDPQRWAAYLEYSYKRNVWGTQPTLLEVWLEKDALSGAFDLIRNYGMTLNVGRGYDGWSSLHLAAERYRAATDAGQDVTILYFGDFDPSGEDMVRSLGARLNDLSSEPLIVKVSLTRNDIERYHLPPNLTKPSDTRAAKHIERYGDVSVELDALPIDVLQARITAEIEARLDMTALAAVREQERQEREHIREVLQAV